MPRSTRIDIAGVLQHVMVRGIERRAIFLDDRDRSDFVERLSRILLKTQTDCFAWCLLSNHAHLLIRPTIGALSEMMQRLLTGYAVTFNLRHHRSGHLFQNRFKSIICDENSYLLELVRYIHLNPIRAGIVPSLDKLDTFKWSGHAGLMGGPPLPGQVLDKVLLLFDEDRNKAREKYRTFVTDGIALGKRDELVGGGLKRHLKYSGTNSYEAYDERVLGSGEFVEHIWHEADLFNAEVVPPPPLDVIIDRVAAIFGIEATTLPHGSKQKPASDARAAICYIAIRKFGYRGIDLSKILGLSKAGVVAAVRRGEKLNIVSSLLDIWPKTPALRSNSDGNAPKILE